MTSEQVFQETVSELEIEIRAGNSWINSALVRALWAAGDGKEVGLDETNIVYLAQRIAALPPPVVVVAVLDLAHRVAFTRAKAQIGRKKNEEIHAVKIKAGVEGAELEAMRKILVEALHLSSRTKKALQRADIGYLGQVLDRGLSGLQKVKRLGPVGLKEVLNLLNLLLIADKLGK